MEVLEKKLTKSGSSELITVTGAEAIVLSLLNEKVDTIFGYPGGAIMPTYDLLYQYRNKINHVLARHEQGAIHAAQGYARVKHKVGVCIATSGPGATNLITGIADAQIDSTPIVCITGQVTSKLLGSDAFQEADVLGISMPVTKWNYQVTDARQIPEAIAKAFYLAKNGRPGPVLLDITKDAQQGTFEYSYKKCEGIRSYVPFPKLNEQSVQDAAELINNARKPYLIVGQGVLLAQAQEELKKFVEKSGIPVASTLLGLSAFPCEHDQYVGFVGMHGNYGPNIKTNECDVLIAVGMRFDDRVTGDLNKYAKQAKVIHIEIDPSEIDKNVKTDVAINADAKEALIALTAAVNKTIHDEWIGEFRACEKIEYDKVIKKELYPQEGSIKMAEVVRIISEATHGEAVIVTDVGQHQMITARYYKYNKTLSNVTSAGLGTMGFALPAAFGAKIGVPSREVIAVIGDGGFQMTIQELGAIAQYGVPVKVIIMNNNFLGMVRQWQELFFEKRYASTELVNPDFVMIAKGYGLESVKVQERSELEGAIMNMLEHEGPYVMEVIVGKEDNVFPMMPAGASVTDIRFE